MLTDLWEGEAEREQWDTDPFMSILTPCDPTFHQLCPQNTVLNLPDAAKGEIRGFSGSCATAPSAGLGRKRLVQVRFITWNWESHRRSSKGFSREMSQEVFLGSIVNNAQAKNF